MPSTLPLWAQKLRELFRSGSVAQFVLFGNTFDVVPTRNASVEPSFLPLKKFLQEVMLEGYDTVITYDRGKGIRVTQGDKDWSEWLSSLAGPEAIRPATFNTREPAKALELIDLYLLRTLNLEAIKSKQEKDFKLKVAVILDFAQFIVPRGDPLNLSGELGSHVVKVLSWANDPTILGSNIATFLITEKLTDINSLIAENPHSAKIEIPLPSEIEMGEYIRWLQRTSLPSLTEQCDMSMDVLAKRMTGLSRIGARTAISTLVNNGQRVTDQFVRSMKKDLIEKECQGLLEFMESPFTLDLVSGHEAVKTWLRQDAKLIREGKSHALPMGYLFTGRIGTGKTFVVQCWAGELGIPCVVLKNFRDKWVGATEGNLERIFAILRALGQVLVFVDEADQMTGKRESGGGDQGLSGRVYAMLAKEMSNTLNRGKIIWVFATSRPDLLEVDLKRQGRLDVHVPLFPPQSPQEYKEMFVAIAKKLKFPVKPEDIPSLPAKAVFGGNEIEAMLIRAVRLHELDSQGSRPLAEVLAEVVRLAKPNAQTKKLEYMDLVAVKECTDASFLPTAYADLSPEEIETRIDELRRYM
ncbi:MAG: AAA family ATPase [Ignavibacteriae bacterium]|nr:AAA family ATPase [Ignavibacteriota bacterium]